MRRRALLLSLALVAGARAGTAQSPEILLHEGFYLESTRCDPLGALDVYEKILDLDDAPPGVIARARLRAGICHDLLGNYRRAREQFRAVTERHSDQVEAARLAERYLRDSIADSPARFMPEEMLFYVEVVEPGEDLIRLWEALQGTPFENPVDLSRARAGAGADAEPLDVAEVGSAAGSTRAKIVDQIAAYLNQSFFRELGKIGGIGFGIPAAGDPDNDHLTVFSLGESDVLPGIVTSFLTIHKPPCVGYARTFPVFRMSSERDKGRPESEEVYMAFGGDIVVLGRPRGLVEDSVERFLSRAPSLAANAGFRKVWLQRAGAFVFAYLGESWLDALERGTREEERPRLASLREVLELDLFHPISARITSTAVSDTLHATLEIGREGPLRTSFWSALSTPRLDPEVLRPVPRESIAFLALELDSGLDRWQSIRASAERLALDLDAEEAARLRDGIARLRAPLESPPGKDLLERVRSIVFGILGGPSPSLFHRLFLVLELDDPERGEEVLRSALSKYAENLLRRSDAGRFRSETCSAGDAAAEWHYLEPIPTARLGYVRIRDRFVVSIAREPIEAALRAAQESPAAFAERVPAGASKVLCIRPQALAPLLPNAPPRDLRRLVLEHVAEAWIHTREGTEALAVELSVPRLTPALRGVLTGLAERLVETETR